MNIETELLDIAARRKFRRLLLLGILFVALLTLAFCYGVSRPHDADTEAQERNAVEQCRRRSNDPATPALSRSFQAEACREMAKQFTSKFHREP
ncbi:hypothetical protein [Burkholderia vietnamiensis]|uniref:hypothetical protein n=1 Tax=Burkholderia vietnamiensis TaxID=60552 RepID=UPI001D14CCB8|nr:hypothetical protein [Burkholderia vietnamiensis]UEC01721.1 hypothetical protein LK462_06750 [Burkholderia vietnamiensis]